MKKFLKGFLFAGKGLSYAFSTQLNFEFHCGAAVLVGALGIYCKLTSAEWIYITFAVGLVLVMELTNTAV
ncbi:MAG: diacylglycerol kinase family protein, partial [Bacteroidia bacterium]